MAEQPVEVEDDLELEEAVELMIRTGIARVNVAAPAKILAYDAAKNSARVQPVIRARTNDGEANRLPPISNVPVLFHNGGGIGATFPLAAGDDCFLLFADKSIEQWLNSGGADITPTSKRRFAFTDAVCIPAGKPYPRPLSKASATAFRVGEQEGALPLGFEIDKGGDGATRGIAIGDGVNDLLKMFDDALAAISTATFGPYPMNPASVATIAAIRAQLDLIRKVS